MPTIPPQIKEDDVLRTLLESTASHIGESFFCSLVKNLSGVLCTHGAWVTEYDPENRKLKALAFWINNRFIENFEYEINGTPCEKSIEESNIVFLPDKVLKLYPNSKLVKDFRTVSYVGVPLLDSDKKIIGHLATLDIKPLPQSSKLKTIFKLFAVRASAELQRVKAELALQEKNECLERLVTELEEAKTSLIQSESRFRSVAQSANDAIITSDSNSKITFWNQRAEIMFGYKEEEVIGKSLTIIMPERYRKLHNRGFKRFMNTGHGKIIGKLVELHAIKKDGTEFPIELTLSDWYTGTGKYVTGIIRDITLRKLEQLKLERAHALLAEEDERKSAELEKARQLQLSMLPDSMPKMKYFDIEVFIETAIEVGGDYYDLVQENNEMMKLVVGDASGHGLEPGMVVATIKSLLASLIPNLGLTEVFNEANSIFKSLNLGRLFMALQIIKFDKREVEICAGGMPPVLIYRCEDKSVEEIMTNSPPIGGMRNFNYSSTKSLLNSGDVILLQTDGFIERLNEKNEIFGYERTIDLFKSVADLSPRDIISKLIKKGNQWGGGHKQDDDITMMVIKAK